MTEEKMVMLLLVERNTCRIFSSEIHSLFEWKNKFILSPIL